MVPLPPTQPPAPTLVRDVEQALPLQEIFPTGTLLLGGAVLIAVVLYHGIVMHWVQRHVTSRIPTIRSSPSTFRVNVVMSAVALALLGAALVELTIWTAVLKYAGIIGSWYRAAAYAASSYTTLGNATVGPEQGWSMLGPVIAISGLFTFSWSGSVLVTVVARLGRAREERDTPTP